MFGSIYLHSSFLVLIIPLYSSQFTWVFLIHYLHIIEYINSGAHCWHSYIDLYLGLHIIVLFFSFTYAINTASLLKCQSPIHACGVRRFHASMRFYLVGSSYLISLWMLLRISNSVTRVLFSWCGRTEAVITLLGFEWKDRYRPWTYRLVLFAVSRFQVPQSVGR